MTTSSIYQPLDKNSRCIRILNLSPNRHPEDNRLQGKLETVFFDENPVYEAVSYTWGEQDHLNFKIWLDDTLVPVRRNLLCALRVFHSKGHYRLWVDALCINQGDNAERGHQVKLMGDVFAKAACVLSWLGTPDVKELNTELDTEAEDPKDIRVPAFELVTECCRILSSISDHTSDIYKRWLAMKHLFEDKSAIEELVRLCQVTYWTRLWIIQEVVLSCQLSLYFGRESLDWQMFHEFRACIQPAEYWLYGSDPQIGIYFQAILGSAPLGRRYHTPLLGDMLLQSKDCICQDRRDKVYGLLGLISYDNIYNSIAVKYHDSLFEVYKSVICDQYPLYGDTNSGMVLSFSRILQQSLLGPDFAPSGYKEISDGRQKVSKARGSSVNERGAISGRVIGTVVRTSITTANIMFQRTTVPSQKTSETKRDPIAKSRKQKLDSLKSHKWVVVPQPHMPEWDKAKATFWNPNMASFGVGWLGQFAS